MTAEVDSRLTPDDLAVYFLSEGEQAPESVLALLLNFIAQAEQSLDFALYDCRLKSPLAGQLVAALQERAAAGVQIRLVYDADKPSPVRLPEGMDPAEGGTGAFVQSLGYPFRRIGGPKLMHHKYIVRDAAGSNPAVWTGSTNFTDDAWTLQENNLLICTVPTLVQAYAQNFAELWRVRQNDGTGEFDVPSFSVNYANEPLQAELYFAPGRGEQIDSVVASLVQAATRRVRICSMLLNSGTLLNALLTLLEAGQVQVDGLYDRTQMADVLVQWQSVPKNIWKIGAVGQIVERAGLAGKDSHRYQPDTPHDFMHNKVLIVDDTVITGSYNFSRSAMVNAENLLVLHSPILAEQYSDYLDRLLTKYH